MEENFDAILSGITKGQLAKANMADGSPNSETEKELINKCEEMFSFSARHKEVPMERAKKNYLLYIGKQWDMRQPSFKQIPVNNIIYGIIEYQVPLMTENKPIIKAEPRNPEDIMLSEGSTRALEYVWEDNDLTQRLPFIMRNVLVYGDHIMKIYWDYANDKIQMDDVEPDYFYPQPYVSKIEEMEWCIHAEPRPLYEIAGTYPNGKYVKAEAYVSPLEEIMDEANADGALMNEPVEALIAEGKATMSAGKVLAFNRALVKEMWINDKTMVKKEKVLQDEETGEPVYEMNEDGTEYKKDENGAPVPKTMTYYERKYPYGRFIVWANNVLLMDAPSPFKHGRAPYVHFHNIRLNRMFWSLGDPVQVASLQTQLNKRLAQLDFIADLNGNPVWICDAGSGVKKGQITNQPGLIIWKRDGSDVHREAPPPIPEYLFRTIDDIKLSADFVSGTMGVVRGEKPGSVTAGSAISELIERALVRIKEKVKYMESSLILVGRMTMSLIRQYWEEPRKFTISGQGHTLMPGMTNPQQGMQGMLGMQGGIQGMLGSQIQQPYIEFSGLSLTADPDIKIVAGSTMPISKANKFEQGILMYQQGIIDRKEFLSYVEYPSADAVDERMAQKEEEQMQMAQQQAQQEQQLKLAQVMSKFEKIKVDREAKQMDAQGRELDRMQAAQQQVQAAQQQNASLQLQAEAQQNQINGQNADRLMNFITNMNRPTEQGVSKSKKKPTK